jgi:hypothetical protein
MNLNIVDKKLLYRSPFNELAGHLYPCDSSAFIDRPLLIASRNARLPTRIARCLLRVET